MAATNSSPNVDNYYSGKGIVKWKAAGASTYRDVGNVPNFEFNPSVTRQEHYSSRSGVRSKDKSVISQRQATVRLTLDEVTADNLAMAMMGKFTDAITLTTTASTHSSVVLDAIASTTGLVVGDSYKITGTGIPAGTYLTYGGTSAGTLSQAATATGTLVAVSITRPIEIDILTEGEIEGHLRFVGTNDIGPVMQVDLPFVNFAPSAAMNLINPEWGALEITGEVTIDPANNRFGRWLWGITAEFND